MTRYLTLQRIVSVMVGGWLLLAVAGCGPSSNTAGLGADQNPNFQKGKQAADRQDYKGAAAWYEKALMVDPQLAQAHLELGLLYDEKLSDPVIAIYHYRRYLELQPDAERRQVVLDFIERAKLSLAAKLPQSSGIDPAELTRLQDQNTALATENATLKSKVAELQGMLTAATTAVRQLPELRPETVVQVVSNTPPPPPSPPVVAERTRARIHIVQRGDTLYSLALKYYGTRTDAKRIYEANRNTMASPNQLKLGQQLVIP